MADLENYQEMEAHFQGLYAPSGGSILPDGAKSAPLTSLPFVGVSTSLLLGPALLSLDKLAGPVTLGAIDISGAKTHTPFGAGWLMPMYQGNTAPSVVEAKAKLQSMLISLRLAAATVSQAL